MGKKNQVAPLTTTDAGELALAVIRYAEKRGWLLSVSVVNVDRKRLAVLSMPGIRKMTNKIAKAKAKLAADTGMATEEVQRSLASGALTLDVLKSDTVAGQTRIGGQPIYYNGVLLGRIGASNMSGEQDRKAIRKALDEMGYDTYQPET